MKRISLQTNFLNSNNSREIMDCLHIEVRNMNNLRNVVKNLGLGECGVFYENVFNEDVCSQKYRHLKLRSHNGLLLQMINCFYPDINIRLPSVHYALLVNQTITNLNDLPGSVVGYSNITSTASYLPIINPSSNISISNYTPTPPSV